MPQVPIQLGTQGKPRVLLPKRSSKGMECVYVLICMYAFVVNERYHKAMDIAKPDYLLTVCYFTLFQNVIRHFEKFITACTG